MTAATFYCPDPPDEIDRLMDDIWSTKKIDYLIYVRRISQRGNPYVRGMLISNDETNPLPPEFEIHPIPGTCVDYVWRQFKEEIHIENNGLEFENNTTDQPP